MFHLSGKNWKPPTSNISRVRIKWDRKDSSENMRMHLSHIEMAAMALTQLQTAWGALSWALNSTSQEPGATKAPSHQNKAVRRSQCNWIAKLKCLTKYFPTEKPQISDVLGSCWDAVSHVLPQHHSYIPYYHILKWTWPMNLEYSRILFSGAWEDIQTGQDVHPFSNQVCL